MYIQLNDIVALVKPKNSRSEHIIFPEINELPGRRKNRFNLVQTRTEKARDDFRFKEKQKNNQLNKNIDLLNSKGLKKPVLKEM